ncbi:hypothetical protein D929_02717 [Enterococcus faecalis 02-MB-P-10]|nr:hypothetical protein D929_02717 [Enterococcus faecalis 02-MB-P-10]
MIQKSFFVLKKRKPLAFEPNLTIFSHLYPNIKVKFNKSKVKCTKNLNNFKFLVHCN